MFNRFLMLVLVVCLGAGLTGCYPNSNQQTGTVVGAVAGGLVGSAIGAGTGQLVAVGAGAVAGALIGGSIGQSMDNTDRVYVTRAVSDGRRTHWVNKRTHREYTVVPVKRVRVSGYRHCQRFYTVSRIDGKRSRVYGTACRLPNGTWRAIN